MASVKKVDFVIEKNEFFSCSLTIISFLCVVFYVFSLPKGVNLIILFLCPTVIINNYSYVWF